MSYSDEHYRNSKLAYDGKLVDAADAVARYKRDRKLDQKYSDAEENVDDLQMTWSDVADELSAPMHDPRAGNAGASRPGGPM